MTAFTERYKSLSNIEFLKILEEQKNGKYVNQAIIIPNLVDLINNSNKNGRAY